MKFVLVVFLFTVSATSLLRAQQPSNIIDKEDLLFLKSLTRSVLDSASISPGDKLPPPFGANNTGGTLIRPGGRDTYPSFWIRDYAMSLECGWVNSVAQKHMLLFTASSQCDQTWITKNGSMVPFGAIPDHILVNNNLPIYFAGTYDYEGQGTKEFGMFPPYCDQFYFIRMASYYVKSTGDIQLLQKEINGRKLIDRLEIAFSVPPALPENEIVTTTENFRGVDFGFRDAIAITGNLCYTSILKYIAAEQMASLLEQLKNNTRAAYYKQIAAKIKKALPGIFLDKNGMLHASTGISGQPDVWATAFSVYSNILDGENALKASKALDDAYVKGTLSYKGSIRHILKSDDFSDQSAWQSALAPKNVYQNGAYWGTPTGWVAYTIALTSRIHARQLVKEYINDLKENDYRKGPGFGAPFECFYPPSYTRGPVYLTTVSCPYIVFTSMENKK